MDKKNLSIGVVLLVGAFAILFFGPRSTPSTQPPPPRSGSAAAPPAKPNPATVSSGDTTTAPEAAAPAASAPSSTFAKVSREAPNATITTLRNDFIEVRLTNFGGAVQEVAFRKYPAELDQPDPYVFNHVHEAPLLALADFPGLSPETPYEVVSSPDTEVVYRTVIDGRLEITRRYRLMKEGEAGADPYRLQHETTFRNLTAEAVTLPRPALSIGTAAPVNASDPGQYLSLASYNGKDATFVARGDLEGGGIGSLVGAGSAPKPMLENPGSVVWVGAKNQFFTSLYTPEKPGISAIARRIELPPFPEAKHPNIGVTAAARFELPALPPNGTQRLAGLLYVGPLEYRRLAQFAHNEDRVLPYTQYFFNRIFLSGYVAPLLNTLLNATHRWVGNWGVAVILMTLILKFVSLPFTLAASKSAKRMSKLQPLMQEIREKYKDNPQKQQQATMELFKAHKVNPLGGCIPVLITMPLFIGFFAMLQSPAELRFQAFLWAKDLAAPDTIGHIPFLGFPINIMPLLMGATMWYQMRLTPTPSVDNMQVKMMKFMPVIFTLFCYSFSCALALYSTINGLFTIAQQMVINHLRDDEPGPGSPGSAAVTTASVLGKGMKNVTPKHAAPKKKLK